MRISVDGKQIEIAHKRIRLDALFEKAGLDPMIDRLALIDSDRGSVSEFCCLHDIVEIFEDMCFVTC